jgi:hypothetical protein
METAMELDELKSAWAALDRHLQQQSTLNAHLFRERKLDKVGKGMRRLYWGKIVQILFGDALIYFGIISTMRHLGNMPLLICSVFMLLYGVLIVVFGGVSLARISRIDYAAPVLEIQKRVGTLHQAHVTANLWAGLPWWFLWIAIFALEMKANVGVDLFVSAPAFVWISAGIGVIGLLATLWFYRQPRTAHARNAAAAPRSLRDAKATLEEIARFERS